MFRFREVDEIEERPLRQRSHELSREEIDKFIDDAEKRIREMLGLPEPQFGPSDEIQENPEKGFFDQNGNALREELTPDEVDRKAYETAKALGVKDPEIDQEVLQKLHTEGIHVNNF